MTAQGDPSLDQALAPEPREWRGVLWLRRRLLSEPNPVWARELKQSVRLQRTPIVLAVITGMMTLLICTIGGLVSVAAEPAKVGVALYHTFFSLAYAVVTWLGPAVASSSIASERSGRTWEALLLTGLEPDKIARGKFLASLTYVASYLVMLAPVGALPFLFGGVTAEEVFAAFVLLGAFAVLAVTFGLAVSSKFSNPAASIIITLIIALPTSIICYVVFGPLLSMLANRVWPSIVAGPPVWLPGAYARVALDANYLVFLILVPALGLLLPSWLFYEITVANLAGPGDDRSSGLRRWFAIGSLFLIAVLAVVQFAVRDVEAHVVTLAVFGAFLIFSAFLAAGEPLGPSRRVRVQFERLGAGALRRYFGPGILRAVSLLVVVGVFGFGVLVASSVAAIALEGRPTKTVEVRQIAAAGAYLAAFFLFLCGFIAWIRAGSLAPAAVRGTAFAVFFFATVGPWIAMAIAGVMDSQSAIIVAAPSPLYIIPMIEAFSTPTTAQHKLLAGIASAVAWALLGQGLLAAAAFRVRRVLREQKDAERRFEALLESEVTQDPVEA
jgi:hypothetical protein